MEGVSNHLGRSTRIVDARGDEHSPLAIDNERSLIIRDIERLPGTHSYKSCCHAQQQQHKTHRTSEIGHRITRHRTQLVNQFQPQIHSNGKSTIKPGISTTCEPRIKDQNHHKNARQTPKTHSNHKFNPNHIRHASIHPNDQTSHIFTTRGVPKHSDSTENFPPKASSSTQILSAVTAIKPHK